MQQFIDCLLYLAWALDITLLVALNTLSQNQTTHTTRTKQLCTHLLNYCAKYPDVGLRYHATKMILHIDFDASYLIVPEAKSRVADYFWLQNKSCTKINTSFLVECRTLKHVVISAAEYETAGVFYNAKTAIPIPFILNEIDHNQPPTPLIMDNNTTEKFIKNNITQKKSKSLDMRYYWLLEQSIKKRLHFQWKQYSENLADHHTKYFPETYHKKVRMKYVTDYTSSSHSSTP